MRKFLIAITLLFVAVINTMAQEHLSFKGIPIEGSMTEFCQKLKTKGFTQLGRDDNVTTFTGDFTGRQATVGVGATDDGKSVHSVVVIFDESSEWNTLVNTYDYYKGLYIRKYGEPSACREHNPRFFSRLCHIYLISDTSSQFRQQIKTGYQQTLEFGFSHFFL